jgi:hypothetical protein
LLLGRAARSRFLLGLLPAGILHFSLVEAHGRTVAECRGCHVRKDLTLRP